MKRPSFRVLRRLVQSTVALAFIAIPLLNTYEYNKISGNFLSFNLAGLPLADPLASLQVMAGTLSATPAMLIGFASALLLAVLLGPVFCSWLCPYGLLSELVFRARPKNADSRQISTVKGGAMWPKTAFVVFGLLVVLLTAPVPFLNQLSMPGWYSRALQRAFLYHDILLPAGVLIITALLLEFILGKRFWCSRICPQSVLISWAGLSLPQRLGVCYSPKTCACSAGDRACEQSCSLALNPRVTSLAQTLQCTNCGDCVDACEERGKALRFGIKGRKGKKP